jgi:hypothetical protein
VEQPVKSQSYSFIANGDVDGDGKIDIADALLALQVAVKIVKPTAAQLSRGDVAPLEYRQPKPDGKIDIGDVVVILEQIVGLVKW